MNFGRYAYGLIKTCYACIPVKIKIGGQGQYEFGNNTLFPKQKSISLLNVIFALESYKQ